MACKCSTIHDASDDDASRPCRTGTYDQWIVHPLLLLPCGISFATGWRRGAVECVTSNVFCYSHTMGEIRKPLSGVLLFVELIWGIAFGFAMTAYLWGMSPTVRPGIISMLMIVSAHMLFLALIMWLLNSGLRRRSAVMLVTAIIFFLLLVVISFPQY